MTDTTQLATGAPALVPPEVESIPPRTTLELPLNILRAALLCASKDESRFYLNGVFLHRTTDGWLRAVATDGHRLLVANLGHWSHLPEEGRPAWLGDGVIVPSALLSAQLGMIAKGTSHKGDRCNLSYAPGGALFLSSVNGDVSFRFDPVEGSFPDYQALVGKADGVFDPERHEDFVPAAFSPANLKSTTAIAAALNADSVMLYVRQPQASEKKPGEFLPDGPSLVTFGRAPGVVVYLMGMVTTATIAPETRDILAPAIRLSIAALKAHQTRNEKAARKTKDPTERQRLTAAAESFKARINAVISRAGAGDPIPALPAPTSQEAAPSYAIGDAVAGDVANETDGEHAADQAAADEEARPPTDDESTAPVAAAPVEAAPATKPPRQTKRERKADRKVKAGARRL